MCSFTIRANLDPDPDSFLDVYEGIFGRPIRFTGVNSAACPNSIARYEWDFGDGTMGTGVTPEHTYIVELFNMDDVGIQCGAVNGDTSPQPANVKCFAVSLTVHDTAGNQDTQRTEARIAMIEDYNAITAKRWGLR